jgi:hypothetical protein
MLQAYVLIVSDVSEVCCKCFIWFAKVDRDVAHIARVYSKCFICFGLCCSKCFHVVSCKWFMWMLHMLQLLYTYIVSALFQMFQTLHTYVAHILPGCCICFTYMFGVFSFGCCIRFTHMLQVFRLDVAYVLQWLHTCFPGVSYVYCKCFN